MSFYVIAIKKDDSFVKQISFTNRALFVKRNAYYLACYTNKKYTFSVT